MQSTECYSQYFHVAKKICDRGLIFGHLNGWCGKFKNQLSGILPKTEDGNLFGRVNWSDYEDSGNESYDEQTGKIVLKI